MMDVAVCVRGTVMVKKQVLMVLLGWGLSVLAACGAEQETVSDGFVDGDGIENNADGDRREQGELLFEDRFEALGPPYVEGHDQPPSALPEALFAQDGSRWTQIQNTHPGENWAAHATEDGQDVLRFFAAGQPGEEASKMDLGRGIGFELAQGDVVVLGADFFVEGERGILSDNTLLDLEDTDDLTIDGQLPGAGLRVRTNAAGQLALDRGELLGSDAGEPPHFRLGNMSSDHVLPVGVWVRVEAVIKLGVGVERSTQGPIDDTFDAEQTEAWCELWVQPRGEPSVMVMRQKGTTFLDRQAGLELLAQELPDATVEWPEALDYNSFQAGLTNNRSGVDQQLLMDNVRLETLD